MTMSKFPTIPREEVPVSREEFYKRRDDRTLRVAESNDYRNARVLITGRIDRLETYSGQIALLTAVNTISRFSRYITVQIPKVELHSEVFCDADTLAEQCRLEMTAADPFGEFDFESTRDGRSPDVTVALGNFEVRTEDTIRFDSRGWLARITKNRPLPSFNNDSLNPVGPGVAGSYAAAETFKAITTGFDTKQPTYTFDAYNLDVCDDLDMKPQLPSHPKSLDLGSIHMVGVGAVGSGTLYFARHLPLEGQMTLIDKDHVDFTNLNRTPLFTTRDAVDEIPKVRVAQRFLPSSISVNTHQQWYEDYIDENGPGSPDILLPLADEYGVRSTIQHNFPPLLIQTNTGSWGVNVRRSIPIEEPCLLCHFPPESPDPTYGCATGPINEISDNDQDEVQGAFPFTTPLAGALLTGELVKLAFDEYPLRDNNVLVGVKSPDTLAAAVSRRDNCGFCSNIDNEIYRRQISDSKFENLSSSVRTGG